MTRAKLRTASECGILELSLSLFLLVKGARTLEPPEPLKSACSIAGVGDPALSLQCPEDSIIRVHALAYAPSAPASQSPEQWQTECRLAEADCYVRDEERAYGCNGKGSCSIKVSDTRLYGKTLSSCSDRRVSRLQVNYSCVHVSQLQDICSPEKKRGRAKQHEGFLSSPGYPLPYAGGASCSLVLVGKRVKLRAESVRLDSANDCIITRDLLSGWSWCGGGSSRALSVLENTDIVSSHSGDFLNVTLITAAGRATVGGVWLHYEVTPLDGAVDEWGRDALEPYGISSTHERQRDPSPEEMLDDSKFEKCLEANCGGSGSKQAPSNDESKAAEANRGGLTRDEDDETASGKADDAHDEYYNASEGRERAESVARGSTAEGSNDEDLAQLDNDGHEYQNKAPKQMADPGAAATPSSESRADEIVVMNNVMANATMPGQENLSATLATTFGCISIVLLVTINIYVMRRTWANSCRRNGTSAESHGKSIQGSI